MALTTGNLGLSYVIIPDSMAAELDVRRQVWSADFAGDQEETEEQLLRLLRPLNTQFATRIETRLSIYQDLVGNKLIALFLGLYLGFTFLLAAAAVLALQQLSQAADNTGRYAILRRLGAEEKLSLIHISTALCVLALMASVLAACAQEMAVQSEGQRERPSVELAWYYAVD